MKIDVGSGDLLGSKLAGKEPVHIGLGQLNQGLGHTEQRGRGGREEWVRYRRGLRALDSL